MTCQRRVILEELKKSKDHPSADEIYRLVRRRLPRISLGTIYRNLETLSEQGEIRKLESAGTLKRYDGTMTPHYHIRCLKCHRIEDIMMAPMTGLETAIDGKTGFEVKGHILEFVGLCPDCAKKG